MFRGTIRLFFLINIASTTSFAFNNIMYQNNFGLRKLLVGTNEELIYDKLNDYLESKIKDNEEIEVNLVKALSWLEKRSKLWKFMPLDLYSKAYLLLKGLNGLRNDTNCDHESFVAMYRNNQAARKNAALSDDKLTRRIDRIMRSIFIDHATRCRPLYVEHFRSLYQKLDKDLLTKVETLGDGYIRGRLTKRRWKPSEGSEVEEQSNEVADFVRNFLHEPLFIEPHFVTYEALKYLSKDDPDAKFLEPIKESELEESELPSGESRKSKISSLVDKYIIDPCYYHSEHLGLQVFVPLSYELNYLPDDSVSNEYIQANIDFYLGFYHHRICSKMLEYADDYIEDLNMRVRIY